MNCLEKDILYRNHENLRIPSDYEIIFANENYLDKIMELQDYVTAGLPDTQTFVGDSREFILNEVMAEGKGIAMGVISDDNLVAFRTISFPFPDSESNLGREWGLPEGELGKVAILEATVVHPDYRGNRLQRKMLSHGIKLIEERGYRYICATVSPFNYPSLSTVMSFGFMIRDIQSRGGVYEGRIRFLLGKDLKEPSNGYPTEIVSVSNSDIVVQTDLLKEGFIGFALHKRPDGFDILYGK
jgi:ribosomal protein S18 acetylase RimI-like enzyme